MRVQEVFTLAAVSIACVPAQVAGQALWVTPGREPGITAEWLLPHSRYSAYMKPMTSALFLSGRIALADPLMLIVGEPLAFGGFTGVSFQSGNPYLGVEMGRRDAPIWVEIGGRPRVLHFADGSGATQVNEYTDLERESAFLADYASVLGALNLQARAPAGVGVRVRVGPEWMIAPYQRSLLLDYGAQLQKARGPLDVSVHLGGNVFTTAAGPIADRTEQQVGFAASYGLAGIRPGVTFRLPLGRTSDLFKRVLGLTLEVPLR